VVIDMKRTSYNPNPTKEFFHKEKFDEQFRRTVGNAGPRPVVRNG